MAADFSAGAKPCAAAWAVEVSVTMPSVTITAGGVLSVMLTA